MNIPLLKDHPSGPTKSEFQQEWSLRDTEKVLAFDEEMIFCPLYNVYFLFKHHPVPPQACIITVCQVKIRIHFKKEKADGGVD